MARRKSNRKKHTFRELTALRDTFIKQLKSKHTPDADRTLDIYHSMRINENGEPRTTISQQVEVLGCRQWQQMIRCLTTGKSTRENLKVCRRRFLCLNCHKWKLQSQVECWHSAIKRVLRQQDTWLGPIVQVRWDLPGLDKRATLNSFDTFVNKTFTAALEAEGITRNQWLICRTFDPIQSSARLVYAGPPIFSDLWLRIYTIHTPPGTISHKSEIFPPEGSKPGRPCPWWYTASDGGEAYLLNSDDPRAGESDTFDRVLRSCLFWCVGNSEDLLHLKREEVWRVYAKYNRTRLFSTRGLLYDSAAPRRIDHLVHPQEHTPTMLVEKQLRDGTVESVLRDPVRLLGAEMAEIDDCSERLCPYCNEPVTNRKHELDATPIEDCKEKSGGEGGEDESGDDGDEGDDENQSPTSTSTPTSPPVGKKSKKKVN